MRAADPRLVLQESPEGTLGHRLNVEASRQDYSQRGRRHVNLRGSSLHLIHRGVFYNSVEDPPLLLFPEDLAPDNLKPNWKGAALV